MPPLIRLALAALIAGLLHAPDAAGGDRPAVAPDGPPAPPRGGKTTTAPAKPGRMPALARTGHRNPVLPDSVLMRIDGREDVTRRRFLRAVRLLGGNPDSLTPGDRDQFLELVLEQRLLAAAALADAQPWPRADSGQFEAEIDNILVRAALSDAFTRIEDRRRALGQPDLDEEAMGVAARESLMVELAPRWDDDLLRLVGSYFAEMPQATGEMSIREQIALSGQSPKVPAADTGRVLARWDGGRFTVADLLSDWRRLSSLYRPQVADDQGVRALAQNGIFERSIRRAAADPALRRRHEVASVIDDRREYHAVSTWLQRELVDGIPYDSLTLLRHYRANRDEFDAPARASLVLLTLDDEASADSLARRFMVPGEAESLAFRAQRSGVSYTLLVTEARDSLLYRQALRAGAGAVVGPERVGGGWRVFKVLALDPSSPRPFEAVRAEVQRSWYETESERRIRGRIDELKARARIEYNHKALRELVLPPGPPAR